MKRIIAAISVLTLITMFASGCTPTDTTKRGVTRNNTVTRNNAVTRNNPLTRNNNVRDNNLTGNTGTTNNTGLAGGAGTTDNTGLAGGAGTTDNTGLTGNTGTTGNTGLVRNNVNNNPNGNINDKNSNYRNPALGDTNKVNAVKDVCTRKENVNDASVAINDNTCYVGLDLENNANLTETMKEDLSTQIRRTDPSITRVYFTEDRGVIDNFVDSVRDTVNVDWNQLQNAFR